MSPLLSWGILLLNSVFNFAHLNNFILPETWITEIPTEPLYYDLRLFMHF